MPHSVNILLDTVLANP